MITDMQDRLNKLESLVKIELENKQWEKAVQIAIQIIELDSKNENSHYITGYCYKAMRRMDDAILGFKNVLRINENRYDAALELAGLYSTTRKNALAFELLNQYQAMIGNSPRHLDLAGTLFTEIGMPERAWPLFERANELQPGIPVLQANLATCAIFVGEMEVAKSTYRNLIENNPEHRKNHYHYSRLVKAQDNEHIEQMQSILNNSSGPVGRDLPLYFAIGKELEDMKCWDQCFDYYHKGCEGVSSAIDYDVQSDINVIETVVEKCDRNWLTDSDDGRLIAKQEPTPIFIVGLPRTGSTLLERIITSHSMVSSVGETLFLQMGILNLSGQKTAASITPDIIRNVADKDMHRLREKYMASVNYRLKENAFFIEKLPFNFLFLGFIAKAWPNAKIIHIHRNPMDACFSMYKQVFTWAYKFSYSLEDLAKYYIAHDSLKRHWEKVLGDRFIEISYESLVSNQEKVTREVIARLGIDFEEACLRFEENEAPSTTASSVQVRNKVHTESVEKWRYFEDQLKPLEQQLQKAGILLQGANN